VTDTALRDLAARAAAGDGSARRELVATGRREARAILSEGRFHEGGHHDGPLHGLFATLGDWLEALLGALPGGAVSGWVLIVGCVVAVATLATSYVRGRRSRAGWAGAPVRVGTAARAAGPAELERRAADAERVGDLSTAIRLRFAAGLLRLDHAEAIELRPSLTSGEVARALGSERFDALARTHDAVAYGGRPAGDDDAAQARDQWPAVVEEARRR
jgi:hypothetical protein